MLRPNYENPRVREGALLRITADLLVPFGELGRFGRPELVQCLSDLGIWSEDGPDPDGPIWIEGVCPAPEPTDEVTVLRQEGDWWILGYWERGGFRVDHRFGSEADACRWVLHDVVSHAVASMGTDRLRPHATDRFRPLLLAALDEVADLIRRDPAERPTLPDPGC